MKPIMFTQKFTCILSFLISIVCPGECVLVESFYISNNTTPTKGQTIELTCTFIVDTGWDINLSIVQASSKVCECYTRIGCTQIIGAIRCSLVENSSEVFVTISNTTRSMEGDWNCETNNVKSLTLLVYTLPSSISFDDIFQQPQFLWENGVTITCKTDQCTYKDPVFTWYYLEADGTKQEFNWSHRVASTNLSNCADKEMIYYSILTLPTNATLAGNKELTTKFECQLSFNKITFHRTSGLTSDVTFAVMVSEVTIKHGLRPLTTGEILHVTENVTEMLTCMTGSSRPPSIINWFIGNTKQSDTGSNFSFTPHNESNGLQIYCTAFNIQAEPEAVESKKPVLYIRVKVSEVFIKHGSKTLNTGEYLYVTLGMPTELTCETGFSRPSPSISWLVGDEKQLSTGKSFNFTPANDNHDSQIYCAAYNIQPENEAVASQKPVLYVRVMVSEVTIKHGLRPLTAGEILHVTENVTEMLTCMTGSSRPPSIINWFIGNTKQSDTGSNFSFTPHNESNGLQIYCTAFNIQAEPEAVESKKPILYVRVKVSEVFIKHGSKTLNTGEYLYVTLGMPTELTCETGFSRPSPSISWLVGEEKQLFTGKSFNFTPANDNHDSQIYCAAYNIQPENEAVASQKPVLYVKVEATVPDILDYTGNTVTYFEGDVYKLQCRSTATRPAAIMSWYHNSVYLNATNSTKVEVGNGLHHVISTITFVPVRSDHFSEISCQSYIMDQIKIPERKKNITVWWPPTEPKVNILGKPLPWLEGTTGELQCVSFDIGNPPSEVKWMGVSGEKTLDHIVVENISYTDNSRSVVCQMDNYFTTTKHQIRKSLEKRINVHFSPKIFIQQSVFGGKLDYNISVNVPFYANPNDTSFMVMANNTVLLSVNQTTIQTPGKYIIMLEEAPFDIHGTENDIIRNHLIFTVVGLQEADFRLYDIRITNSIGTGRIFVNITSENVPVMPKEFRLLEQRGFTLIFHWRKQFDGGHPQEFWIQTTPSEQDNWSNKTIVKGLDHHCNFDNDSCIANISGLELGTYRVRIIAANIIGNTEPVMLPGSISVSSGSTETFSVVAAVGGGVGSAVVIIGTIVLILVLRKKTQSKLTKDDYKNSILSPKRVDRTRQNDDLPVLEVNLNPVYESADSVHLQSNIDNTYALVNKMSNQQKPGSSAEIKKPEKGEPSLRSVYENSNEIANELLEVNNVYDNSSCNTSDETPRQRRNEDGLIYIYLELSNPNAENRTPLIHGEEDRTVYAEVVYGQVGDQVPNSDDEGKAQKT